MRYIPTYRFKLQLCRYAVLETRVSRLKFQSLGQGLETWSLVLGLVTSTLGLSLGLETLSLGLELLDLTTGTLK